MTKDNSKTKRELVVDGESFRLKIAGPSYQPWLSGPNRNYGFGGTLAGGRSVAERSAVLAAQLTEKTSSPRSAPSSLRWTQSRVTCGTSRRSRQPIVDRTRRMLRNHSG
jgi:hypothetical protein